MRWLELFDEGLCLVPKSYTSPETVLYLFLYQKKTLSGVRLVKHQDLISCPFTSQRKTCIDKVFKKISEGS